MVSSLSLPKIEEVLIQRLRTLSLDVSDLEESGFTLVDDEKVTMAHLTLDGYSDSTIWLIPSLLIDQDLPRAYGSDKCLTHYTQIGAQRLVLCEDLVDAMLLAQAIQQAQIDDLYTVAASSIWHGIPNEWKTEAWWKKWTDVQVVGSTDYAREIQALARREIVSLSPIHLEDDQWKALMARIRTKDWLQGGETLFFLDTTSDGSLPARPLPARPRLPEPFRPANIHGAYFGGHLYYAFRGLDCSQAMTDIGGGQVSSIQVERKGLWVIKSDGSLLTVVESPAPPGTPSADRILRLSDGTLITGYPETTDDSSWSVDSIRDYAIGDTTVRPLHELLADIMSVLRSRVWLPQTSDYYVLVLAAAASYVQSIFSALPILLVTGPPGIGKSELGDAMCSVAANGQSIAEATAATISRVINRSRGFTVLDDLEKIRKTTKANFNEVRQILKLGYKKSTANRIVTEGGEQIYLNHYGIKMINLTQSTDDIIRSRALEIAIAKMPADFTLPTSWIDTIALRDALHIWAFSNVAAIAAAYRAIPRGIRIDEITAPLRAMARLSGVPAYEANLDLHLKPPTDPGTECLEFHLRAIVNEMIDRGATLVNSSEVASELIQRLAAAGIARPPCVRSAWVGTMLRSLGYVADGAQEIRKREAGTYRRKYPLLAAATPVGAAIVPPELGGPDGPLL